MDKQQAQTIIKEVFEESFNKDRFNGFIKNFLNQMKDAPFDYQGNYIPDAYKPFISRYERLGKYNDGEKRIDILIVYLNRKTSIERARTSQRNFIAGYLDGKYGSDVSKDAALVAFVSPNEEDWRFSLVKMDYRFEQAKNGKVKVREEFTPARRWSFLVGKNESSHTAQSRLVPRLADDERNPTLAQMEEAFNIEKVTKEFFGKYRELFLWTKETLDKIVERDTKIKADFEKKGVDTIDFAKKLIGQVVFLYFLQKKGWFGVERDAEWGTGTKHFLRELFDKKHGDYNNFFNDVLEHLFYDALRDDRSYNDYYYGRFNCKIPFLNGGLFDPINGYDWVHTDILLPNELFSNQNKTKEGDKGNGILDIFDRYNFTVKEDEPLEKEVAVDPEMLGKVFENLLEVKDRKSKGTYYTPREIVHYMCQQSLINYLNTELNKGVTLYQDIGDIQTNAFGNEAKVGQLDLTVKHKSGLKITKEDIEILIKYGEQFGENETIALEKERNIADGKQQSTSIEVKLPAGIRKNAKLIDEKLASIKVCDPAIGSGAFPVSMMHEIVKTRNVLTAFLSLREAQATKQSQIGDRCAGTRDDNRTVYHFKRECIEKSLYGVDIDPGAVEIAKLRLWLSLMVDEEDIKQIKPLPNLDYKIVCGNSLLGYPYTPMGLEKVEKLKELFFNETRPKEKNELREQIDYSIYNLFKNTEKSLGYKVNFDFKINFSEVFHENKGFDVAIANPPYVRQERIKVYKPLLQKSGYKVYNSTSDIYTYFYEKSFDILAPDKFLCFISSNKWMRAKYGEKLRHFVKENTEVLNLIDFGGYPVFEATVDTNIILFKKTKPYGEHQLKYVNMKNELEEKDLITHIEENQNSILQKKLNSSCWTLADEKVLKLKEKIEKVGVPLRNWDVKINRGVLTGYNKAFIIDDEAKKCLCREDPRSAEVLKPILRGRDIKRYYYKWVGLWMIKIEAGWTNRHRGNVDPKEFFEQQYPAIYRHLISYAGKKGKGKGLFDRDDKGNYWWELRDCTYYQDFEKEKIVWREISEKPSFILDVNRLYTNQTAYILISYERKVSIKYLLSVLNSKLIDFYQKQISYSLGEKGTRWIKQFVEQLPVPKIPESEQKPFLDYVDHILSITKDPDYSDNSQKQAKAEEIERKIDQMVYKLYGLTEKEIGIVEGGK